MGAAGLDRAKRAQHGGLMRRKSARRAERRGPVRGTVERCQGGPALRIEPRGKSAALEQHETAGRCTHKSQLQVGSIAERGDQMAQVKPAAGETRSEDADGVNGKVGEVREGRRGTRTATMQPRP